MKLTTLEQLMDSIERVADELENIDVDLSDYLTKDEASSTYLEKTAQVSVSEFGTSDAENDGTAGIVPAPPATPTYKVLTSLGWRALDTDTPIAIDTAPITIGTLTYDGTAKTPTWLYYDPVELQIGGVYQNQINAGTYQASFTPTGSVSWINGTKDTIFVNWTINKAACTATLSNSTGNVNIGSTSTFTINRTGDGVITATSSNTDIATVEVNGTNILVTGQALGTAVITVNVAEGTNHLAADTLTYTATVQKMPLNLSATLTGNVPYNGTGIISIQGNLGGGAVTALSSNPDAITITNITPTNVTVKCLENTLQVVPVVIEVAETAQYMSGTCTCNVTTTLKQGELRLSSYSGTATYGSPVTFVITSNTSGGALSVSAENENFATASLKGSTVTVTALNCSVPTQTITVTSAATDLFAETTAHYTVTMEKVTPTLELSCGTDTVILTTAAPAKTVSVTTNSAGTITAYAENNAVCNVNVFENTIQLDGAIRGTTNIVVNVAATPVSEAMSDTFTVTYSNSAETNLLINGRTLEQLQSVIKNGQASTTLKTGDYFDITLPQDLVVTGGDTDSPNDVSRFTNTIVAGTTWRCYIMGIDHNPTYEGYNRVHFIIISNDVGFIANTNSHSHSVIHRPYNTKIITNAGGWKACGLRAWLNSTFFDALPSDLKAVISPCTKYTDNVGNASGNVAENVSATTDNIFIMSLKEYTGKSDHMNTFEAAKQLQYSYSTFNKLKIRINSRSPVQDSGNSFISYVDAQAGLTVTNGQAYGKLTAVFPCFTIA